MKRVNMDLCNYLFETQRVRKILSTTDTKVIIIDTSSNIYRKVVYDKNRVDNIPTLGSTVDDIDKFIFKSRYLEYMAIRRFSNFKSYSKYLFSERYVTIVGKSGDFLGTINTYVIKDSDGKLIAYLRHYDYDESLSLRHEIEEYSVGKYDMTIRYDNNNRIVDIQKKADWSMKISDLYV